ncbi:protein SREK1IP1-like isoform X2 [Uloborus diversus]|nr:protein SREK1IP1-like isoform X2 [Uloborus diversus]XP_054708810.1 protein SREK1IP1-like isoform X2 [Uloborus diversus]XP_054708811.1 protein SREK1IP1-like isoform X2 [Uloborus diversus]XP_054708812.1 protein SREK1IP1-like isoform X2 [Uloborus diversus]
MARLTNQTVDNIRPACKKCGYPGHFTYQCRNFLKVNPNKDIVLDISSTSSEGEEDFVSPLTELNQKERSLQLKKLQDDRQEHPSSSTFKKRHRSRSPVSISSGSDDQKNLESSKHKSKAKAHKSKKKHKRKHKHRKEKCHKKKSKKKKSKNASSSDSES